MPTFNGARYAEYDVLGLLYVKPPGWSRLADELTSEAILRPLPDLPTSCYRIFGNYISAGGFERSRHVKPVSNEKSRESTQHR